MHVNTERINNEGPCFREAGKWAFQGSARRHHSSVLGAARCTRESIRCVPQTHLTHFTDGSELPQQHITLEGRRKGLTFFQ